MAIYVTHIKITLGQTHKTPLFAQDIELYMTGPKALDHNIGFYHIAIIYLKRGK